MSFFHTLCNFYLMFALPNDNFKRENKQKKLTILAGKSAPMKPVIQDIVILINTPPEPSPTLSCSGGNMLLNRYCIDEELAFESSGVYYFKKNMPYHIQAKGEKFK